MPLDRIAVDGFHGESRKADRDVFGAVFVGSGVTDPFAGVGDDGLSGGDVERTILMFDAKRAFENDGEFVEGGSLAGFEPSTGAAHVRDAGRCGLGVDASDVFVDELGFVAGGLDASGLRDQCGHGNFVSSFCFRGCLFLCGDGLFQSECEECNSAESFEGTLRRSERFAATFYGHG